MKFSILQLGRLGDLILLTAAIGAIKKIFPDSEITVIAGWHNYTVLEQNPNIKNIIIYKKSFLGILKSFFSIRKEKYDWHIDPKDHYSTESRIFASIIRANNSVGYNQPGRKVFDISIPFQEENKNLHYTLRCFNALKPLGINMPDEIPKPELFTSPDSDKFVSMFMQKLPPKEIISINISASHPRKMWQTEKWVKVINSLHYSKYNLVLTFAPSEIHQAKEISALCPNINVFQSRNILDVFSIIKNSLLLITPDTAVVHIAAAFNVPLLGLYSGLDDFLKKFHPLSNISQVISAPKGFDGIEPITPFEVISGLEALLKKIEN
jgi:ADP-heptose:LPS heptosyltransferase